MENTTVYIIVALVGLWVGYRKMHSPVQEEQYPSGFVLKKK